MIKALARAFRWREMLESGAYATITEMAHAERIDHGYLGRILRLTLLAPDIVEAVLSGSQPEGVTIAAFTRAFPLMWQEQRRTFRHAAQLSLVMNPYVIRAPREVRRSI